MSGDDQPSAQQRLASLSLTNIKLGSKKNAEQRKIKDTELLNTEQWDYLEGQTQKRFYSKMEQIWAKNMMDEEIVCETFEGTQISVDRGSIRVIDKGYKGASHCICGKAIRYEYWIGTYGPIGSVHIVEHTNLDKEFVSDITKGYAKENEMKREIVKMLADWREENKTFDDWSDTWNLKEKEQFVDYIRNGDEREMVRELLRLQLPLPEKLRNSVNLAKRKVEYEARQTQYAAAAASPVPPVQTTQALQPAVASAPSSQHSALLTDIDRVLARSLTQQTLGFSEYNRNTLTDLRSKIGAGQGTPARLSYARTLVEKYETSRVKDSQNATTSKSALQRDAAAALTLIVNQYPHDRFAASLHKQAMQKGLTEPQLACVFSKKTSKGKPGLYYRYSSVMKKGNIPKHDV